MVLASLVLGLLAAGGQAPGGTPPAPAAQEAAPAQDRFAMPAAFQRQSERRIAEYLPRLRTLVRTEDPALNALVERIYAQCVTGKLFDPMPPELPYRWFAPGGSYYLGQWLWDTMFVLLAFAPLDDDAVVREVFENYWYTVEHNPDAPPGSARYGMVPNFLGARELREDGRGWPPVGYSQIPILGWGALGVYRQTNDRALVERALPMLVAFDEWYSHERDVDGDLLIEYGAYEAVGKNDLLQTARFETFDFHLTLDGMRMTPHPRRPEGGAFYGNVEGVEQTSFLLMTERAIGEIARELGRIDLARRYEKTVERRVAAMRAKMWDPKDEFFYSLDRDSDRPIRVRTIQAFLTLAAGVPTPAQAASLARQLRDPKRWWSPYPVPTAAMDEPKYDPRGYWRGDMWPPTTYLVACGLRRYGHHGLARELTDRLRALVETRGISEDYDSRTGDALGVPGLGMSSTVWSAIVENVYGVQDDFRTIRVPEGGAGRRLRLGKLEVGDLADGVVEVRTAFAREMRVVLPGPPPARPAVRCDGRPREARVVEGAVVFAAPPGETCRVERGR
jgi:Mannosylglycerate hydrolase MGH1-like glycoside hydrolase domain